MSLLSQRWSVFDFVSLEQADKVGNKGNESSSCVGAKCVRTKFIVPTESAVDYTDMDLMLKEERRPDHPLDGVSRPFITSCMTSCWMLKVQTQTADY